MSVRAARCVKQCLCAGVAALLAACGAAAAPSVPSRFGSSGMAAGATSAPRLLYVSDLGSFDVFVYRFPSLAPAGKLTGFRDPQGVCSDAAGNVWIADTRANEMVEYAHGGSKPIATLNDPLGFPAGCAVDVRSGDLAVANLGDFSGGGSVLIYRHASGTPRAYANPRQVANYFAAYDPGGDLYVSGESSRHAYLLSVLPHGGSAMSSVTITGGRLHFPGTVAWQGATLVLGDQRCGNRATSCLYELTVSGKTARITGTTPLAGSCDVAQAWVGASRIAGGDDAQSCRKRSSVDLWAYPAGGKPARSTTGPRIPVGATVSDRSGS